MASEEKPGWFGRLFGRKGQPAPEDKPEDKPEAELPAEAASPSEGEPDFATAAEDVAHVPLPLEETGEPVPDVVEGADLLPVAG
jgi:fused signal recognition particle receptor